MTTEERFERIETAFQKMLDFQEGQQKMLTQMMESTLQWAGAAEQRFSRLEQSIAQVDETIARQAAAADARMTRIEENLNALIRAITAEDSDGKGQLP